MANPFDRFDNVQSSNPFDRFDAPRGISNADFGKTDADVERMRQEFVKKEGSLGTRVRNTKLKDAAYNAIAEVPRLAQEMVTVPVNSAIKSAYGLAAIPVAAVSGADKATELINSRPQINGPLDPSVTSETIGYGIDKVNNALPDNTVGDLTRAGIEAGLDIAGLIGGAKGIKRAGSLAKDAGAKTVVKAIGNKPERLMESTLKQSTVLPQATRAKNVQTALEGEYIPSKKGAAKLESDISAINDRIGAVIDEAKNNGNMIDVNSVITRLDGLRSKANESPMWKENNAAIDRVLDGLKTNPNVQNGSLPADIAQRMKVKIGQDVKYGQFTTFEGEGLKGIARGLKEELAAQFPELAELNAKDSALYSLQKQLDRAVNRIGNRETVGIGPAVKVAGGAAAGTLGAALGAITAAIEHPAIAPRIAFQLYKSRKGAMSRTQALTTTRQKLQSLADIVKQTAIMEAGAGGQYNDL